MKCPSCGKRIRDEYIASYLGTKRGKATSEAKTRAARENGRRGGRPRKVTASSSNNSSSLPPE